jgi:hypothetical protein
VVPGGVGMDITFGDATLGIYDSAGNSSVLVQGSGSALDQFSVVADAILLNGSTPALLEDNQTFSGQNTFNSTTAPLTIANTLPVYRIDETDAAADERRWREIVSGGSLSFETRNDADSTGNTWLQVDRTGTTVDSVTLLGSRVIVTNPDTATASTDLFLDDGDAAANERLWRFRGNTAGQLQLGALADNLSSGTNFMLVDRTSTTIDSVILQSDTGLTVRRTGADSSSPYVGLQDASSNNLGYFQSILGHLRVQNPVASGRIDLIPGSGGHVTFPSIATTASAANAFIDTGLNNALLRSTSSIRYKTDVQDVDPQMINRLSELRPITYRSKAPADDPNRRWIGLIAEEVDGVYPELVNYDKEGRPDGVQYERLTVLLLKEIQDLRKRVAELEAK